MNKMILSAFGLGLAFALFSACTKPSPKINYYVIDTSMEPQKTYPDRFNMVLAPLAINLGVDRREIVVGVEQSKLVIPENSLWAVHPKALFRESLIVYLNAHFPKARINSHREIIGVNSDYELSVIFRKFGFGNDGRFRILAKWQFIDFETDEVLASGTFEKIEQPKHKDVKSVVKLYESSLRAFSEVVSAEINPALK